MLLTWSAEAVQFWVCNILTKSQVVGVKRFIFFICYPYPIIGRANAHPCALSSRPSECCIYRYSALHTVLSYHLSSNFVFESKLGLAQLSFGLAQLSFGLSILAKILARLDKPCKRALLKSADLKMT